MDKLESLIERAMPLSSCQLTNQNIRAKRAWLKREIEKLYGVAETAKVGPTVTK